jgi:hypothetical protein
MKSRREQRSSRSWNIWQTKTLDFISSQWRSGSKGVHTVQVKQKNQVQVSQTEILLRKLLSKVGNLAEKTTKGGANIVQVREREKEKQKLFLRICVWFSLLPNFPRLLCDCYVYPLGATAIMAAERNLVKTFFSPKTIKERRTKFRLKNKKVFSGRVEFWYLRMHPRQVKIFKCVTNFENKSSSFFNP